MRFAAIDIGSNAGRLLIAHTYLDGKQIKIKKEYLIRVPLRLGYEVFTTGRIPDTKINELINSFKAFSYLLKVYQPVSYRACGTEALRKAENYQEVISLIKKETNIQLHLINGASEAKYIFNAYLPYTNPLNNYLHIDVGGGSTEISFIHENKQSYSASFEIGTIRSLLNLNNANELKNIKKFIKNNIRNNFNIHCIGTGGNINKLQQLFNKKEELNLTYSQLKKGRNQLSNLSQVERINIYKLRPDRADVIIPAADIFLKIMKWSNCQTIHVPNIGLADGIIYDLYQQYSPLEEKITT